MENGINNISNNNLENHNNPVDLLFKASNDIDTSGIISTNYNKVFLVVPYV